MPAWVEMEGRFGLARSLVAVWEDYEDTAYLRTHGAVPELFRTCHITMSDNGGTHVDGTYHFDPLGERIAEVPLHHFYRVRLFWNGAICSCQMVASCEC